MAVVLLSPANLSGPLPATFTWNSDDGSYCWQNYIDFFDQGGTLFESSGTFNPNGGDSTYTLNDAPSGTTSIQFQISCNPDNLLSGSYSLPSANDPGDDDTSTGEPQEPGDGTTVIELITPEYIPVQFDTGLTVDDRSQLMGAAATSIVIAFGVAILLKVLR